MKKTDSEHILHATLISKLVSQRKFGLNLNNKIERVRKEAYNFGSILNFLKMKKENRNITKVIAMFRKFKKEGRLNKFFDIKEKNGKIIYNPELLKEIDRIVELFFDEKLSKFIDIEQEIKSHLSGLTRNIQVLQKLLLQLTLNKNFEYYALLKKGAFANDITNKRTTKKQLATSILNFVRLVNGKKYETEMSLTERELSWEITRQFMLAHYNLKLIEEFGFNEFFSFILEFQKKNLRISHPEINIIKSPSKKSRKKKKIQSFFDPNKLIEFGKDKPGNNMIAAKMEELT